MHLVNCCWSINDSVGAWPSENEILEDLPALVRRRLTALGLKALKTIKTCAANLGEESIPWVISCRNGDTKRRLKLLSNLANKEMLSPTDFSMSVHNAMVGVYSILSGNKETHTALAGGKSSFEMGLLESIALLKEKGGAVGYIYYDYVTGNRPIDQPEDHDIECLAMIIRSDDIKSGLKIGYEVDNKINMPDEFNITQLLDYLENDEKKYRIPVAGGAILLERAL